VNARQGRSTQSYASWLHQGGAPRPPFETTWDFVKALTQADRTALEIAAGAVRADLPIDSATVRKLLATSWFRSVFPLLSDAWRGRMLDALSEIDVGNHPLRLGRRTVRLADLSYEQLRDISGQTVVPGMAGSDLQLLLAIGQLWGETAFQRLRFVEIADPSAAPGLGSLFGRRG
jgi:hypothetical protein